jgi:hypothetical protein
MTIRMRSVRPLCATLVAALLSASVSGPLIAQATSTRDGPSHAVSFNPFFLLAGWLAGEYEQRLNPSVTIAGGVSYFRYSDDHYTNFEAKARLYPSEHAMRGLSLAGSLGVTQISYVESVYGSICDFSCNDVRKTTTSPAFGIELGYQWLLGHSGRTAINLGIGAKRFLATKSSLGGSDPVIPTTRLGVGYAW